MNPPEEFPRKLIRGLKDLSPLFAGPKPTPRFRVTQPVESAGQKRPDSGALKEEGVSLGVVDPENPSSTLSLILPLASELDDKTASSLVLAVKKEGWDEGIERQAAVFGRHGIFFLSQDDLSSMCRRVLEPVSAKPLKSYSFLVVLPGLPEVTCGPVLDLVEEFVLILRPTASSLLEGIRWIQAANERNPNLDFFVMTEGFHHEESVREFYERFSKRVSHSFGLSLGWLGPRQSPDLDVLFWNGSPPRPQIAKERLSQWVCRARFKS